MENKVLTEEERLALFKGKTIQNPYHRLRSQVAGLDRHPETVEDDPPEYDPQGKRAQLIDRLLAENPL